MSEDKIIYYATPNKPSEDPFLETITDLLAKEGKKVYHRGMDPDAAELIKASDMVFVNVSPNNSSPEDMANSAFELGCTRALNKEFIFASTDHKVLPYAADFAHITAFQLDKKTLKKNLIKELAKRLEIEYGWGRVLKLSGKNPFAFYISAFAKDYENFFNIGKQAFKQITDPDYNFDLARVDEGNYSIAGIPFISTIERYITDAKAVILNASKDTRNDIIKDRPKHNLNVAYEAGYVRGLEVLTGKKKPLVIAATHETGELPKLFGKSDIRFYLNDLKDKRARQELMENLKQAIETNLNQVRLENQGKEREEFLFKLDKLRENSMNNSEDIEEIIQMAVHLGTNQENPNNREMKIYTDFTLQIIQKDPVLLQNVLKVHGYEYARELVDKGFDVNKTLQLIKQRTNQQNRSLGMLLNGVSRALDLTTDQTIQRLKTGTLFPQAEKTRLVGGALPLNKYAEYVLEDSSKQNDYEISTEEKKFEITGDYNFTHNLKFGAKIDGKKVFFGDFNDLENIVETEQNGHKSNVLSAKVSENGLYVASVDESGLLVIREGFGNEKAIIKTVRLDCLGYFLHDDNLNILSVGEKGSVLLHLKDDFNQEFFVYDEKTSELGSVELSVMTNETFREGMLQYDPTITARKGSLLQEYDKSRLLLPKDIKSDTARFKATEAEDCTFGEKLRSQFNTEVYASQNGKYSFRLIRSAEDKEIKAYSVFESLDENKYTELISTHFCFFKKDTEVLDISND